MGEVAERVGRFVTAYSSDLRDESLDGQRVVVGGIVTGSRTVITKAKATMAIVTMEDLQGTIEVVVFPRLYETDRPARGATARSCWSPVGSTTRARRSRCSPTSRSTGTTPSARGPGGVRAPGRGGRPGRRRGGRAAGRFRARRTAAAGGRPRRPIVPVGRGHRSPAGGPGDGRVPAPAGRPAGDPVRLATRAGATQRAADLPPIAPAEPVSDLSSTRRWRAVGRRPRRRAVGARRGARPDRGRRHRRRAGRRRTGHGPPRPVRRRAPPSDRVVGAMETFKSVLRDRPGATRVVIHVPAPGGGAALPMELRRGVAYDAELLAEVRRRLGDGLVEIRLAERLTASVDRSGVPGDPPDAAGRPTTARGSRPGSR